MYAGALFRVFGRLRAVPARGEPPQLERTEATIGGTSSCAAARQIEGCRRAAPEPRSVYSGLGQLQEIVPIVGQLCEIMAARKLRRSRGPGAACGKS